MPQLMTVQSAPVSTRNGVCTQEASAAKTRPRITGRSMPSSQRRHSPATCIYPSYLVARDILKKEAIVFRMCRPGEYQHFDWGIGDEQFLSRHTDELATIPGEDLSSVS